MLVVCAAGAGFDCSSAQLAWVFNQIRLLVRSVICPLALAPCGFLLMGRSHGLTADVNPIGGISKTDLKRFIAWAQEHFQLPVLSK